MQLHRVPSRRHQLSGDQLEFVDTIRLVLRNCLKATIDYKHLM
jgi:hypothetical protein